VKSHGPSGAVTKPSPPPVFNVKAACAGAAKAMKATLAASKVFVIMMSPLQKSLRRNIKQKTCQNSILNKIDQYQLFSEIVNFAHFEKCKKFRHFSAQKARPAFWPPDHSLQISGSIQPHEHQRPRPRPGFGKAEGREQLVGPFSHDARVAPTRRRRKTRLLHKPA
jgi:hypothetical protein